MRLLPFDLPMSKLTVDDGFDRCTRCGLCLAVCPTYAETRREMTGPRGRIAIMADHDHTQASSEYIRSCLRCAQCETVCPTSVPYGQLIRAYLGDEESDAIFEHKLSGSIAFGDDFTSDYLPEKEVHSIPPSINFADTLLLTGHVIPARMAQLEDLALNVLHPVRFGTVLVDRNRWIVGLLEHGLRELYNTAINQLQELILRCRCSTVLVLDPWLFGAIQRHRASRLAPQLPEIHSITSLITNGTFRFNFEHTQLIDRTPSTVQDWLRIETLVKSSGMATILLPRELIAGGALPLMDKYALSTMVEYKNRKHDWCSGQTATIVTTDPLTLLRHAGSRHLLEYVANSSEGE